MEDFARAEVEEVWKIYPRNGQGFGLRGGALELGIPPETARTRFRRADTDNEDVLPIRITDPLIPRDEWQCKFRKIIGVDVRPNVGFCAGSFEDPQLVAFCDQLTASAR